MIQVYMYVRCMCSPQSLLWIVSSLHVHCSCTMSCSERFALARATMYMHLYSVAGLSPAHGHDTVLGLMVASFIHPRIMIQVYMYIVHVCAHLSHCYGLYHRYMYMYIHHLRERLICCSTVLPSSPDSLLAAVAAAHARDAPLRSSASRAQCLGTLYPRAHCCGFLGPELRRGCAEGSVYVWRRAAAVVEELAGQVWRQLIMLLVHTSIVCSCSQQLHSPFIAKPHYLFDLGECNTVSGAGVEGLAGQVWRQLRRQLIMLLVHTSIVCPCAQPIHC